MRASKREMIVTYALLAAALLAFTFLDRPLSMAVFNLENLYGRIFEAVGEAPGTLIAAFCTAALLVTRDTTSAWKNILSLVGFGLLTVLSSFMSAMLVANYVTDGHISMPLVLVAGLLISALLFLLASRLDKAQRVQIRRAAIVGLLLMFAAMIVVNVIKVGWGRPRFRSMTDPMTEFTPWYAIQGKAAGEEFKSFPSGHTANASIILWISLLPSFVKKLKGKENLLMAIAWVWIILVAFSRIIMGAHFATDVIMGATITYTCFTLLRAWQYRERKIPVNANDK